MRNLREWFNSSSCDLFIAATKKIRIAMMIALINGRWIAKLRIMKSAHKEEDSLIHLVKSILSRVIILVI